MPAIEQPTTKVCKVCGKELPLDSFPKQVKSKDGHMNMCRDCFSAKHAHQKAEPAARAAAKAPDDEELDKILAAVPAKTLIAELHRRGWKGTLTFTLTETL